MQKIAWSYLDRAAAGDFVRSSIVLSKFATSYQSVREQLAEATGVAVSAMPRTLEPSFTQNTSLVLGFVLSALAMDSSGRVQDAALREATLQVHRQTAASVGTLFRNQIEPRVPASSPVRAFVDFVAGKEPDRLAVALDGAIAESFECSSTSFESIISELAKPAAVVKNAVNDALSTVVSSRSSTAAVTELEPTVIRARSGQAGLPAWVLYGIGAVAVGVAGYALWRAAS